MHTGLRHCILSSNTFDVRIISATIYYLYLSCPFLPFLHTLLSFFALLSLPAGAGSSSAGIQGSAGYWGRRPGYSHPGELAVAKGHCGQPRSAQGTELLPASRGSWDFFPPRQGRETHHGTCLFPFSGESRCPFIHSCSAPRPSSHFLSFLSNFTVFIYAFSGVTHVLKIQDYLLPLTTNIPSWKPCTDGFSSSYYFSNWPNLVWNAQWIQHCLMVY